MNARKNLALATLAALEVAACSMRPGHDWSARGSGGKDAPAVARMAPDALVSRCGRGHVTEQGRLALVRAPYLQQVTHDSALLLFTSRDKKPVTIDVTLPDGKHVTSALSGRDASARPKGASQALAQINGLAPRTEYCYQLRGLTEPAAFVTAPLPGAGVPVRFVVFGDSGDGGSGQRAVLEQIGRVPFDLVLHTGDVAYTDGRLDQLEDYFFGVYAPLLKSIPFYPASGNHDYRTQQAAPFLEVFALPRNGDPSDPERYYSYDWGDVHFVVLDTERISTEQLTWLDADLASSALPWKVVYGHKPPFSSGAHGSSLSVRSSFVPILERHAVPLMLSGHEHSYERTLPLRGVTYVVTGGGGRSARDVGRSEFTAHSESALHFVQVEVRGDKLVLHAIDAVGREFDTVKVTRAARPG
jgi:hypothetical protein